MDLRLTETIQTAVKKALAKPEFSEKYKEEAEKISNLESVSKEPYPVSTDLVEYVAKLLGITYTLNPTACLLTRFKFIKMFTFMSW